MGNKKQSRRQTIKRKIIQKNAGVAPVVKEWLGQLLFAFTVMLFVHTFIFQPFVVPTPSMASTVLPGEYLIVSRLHYGPRTPRTLGIPYTDFYIDGITLPAIHLPGFSSINRGDVVVFHYPPETELPIDKRQPYLKRTLGLPGEQIELRDKKVFIDGAQIQDFAGLQQFWHIYKTDPRVNLPYQKLKDLGVEEIIELADPVQTRIIATEEAAAEIASWPYVDKVVPFVDTNTPGLSARLFPPNRTQTPDNYGPLWIPKAGARITLNDDTWVTYHQVINEHEPHTVARSPEGSFMVDGAPATDYTFSQDYYFMMGDNRDNSLDSRYWGFVPDSHIMGKAVARFYSWDKEAGWPRFDRLFDRIR